MPLENDLLLKVQNLRVWFSVRRAFSISNFFSKKQEYLRAVDGISFSVARKDSLCLAGESGCGKTTTARAIIRTIPASDGSVHFKGIDILQLKKRKFKPFRRKMQMIFQDPYASLNPRMAVGDIVAEPLEVNNLVETEAERTEMVMDSLESVGLTPHEFIDRYPHELSGGERQRVALAAALILKPDLVVADEPVSMLDASLKAGILKLFMNLQKEFSLSYLFITHELSVARYISERIAVMYLGKIVELGPTESVISNSLHPYTRALISVVPIPDPCVKRERILLKGEIPSPVNLPPGCRFHPRCPFVESICRKEEPEIAEIGKRHFVACHLQK
jgi:peptide/nickel transport system ATP-binding protein